MRPRRKPELGDRGQGTRVESQGQETTAGRPWEKTTAWGRRLGDRDKRQSPNDQSPDAKRRRPGRVGDGEGAKVGEALRRSPGLGL